MEPISRNLRAEAGLAATRLDPGSAVPLYRQIYDALRRDILAGTLGAGRRLSATRVLARELGVSRNTVLEAVEQLVAEGYLTSRVGSGTFVAEDLPDDFLGVGALARAVRPAGTPELSSRGESFRGLAAQARRARDRPFQLGRPAVDRFPWRTWSRLTARRSRELPRQWLDYSDPDGYGPLRQALAGYLYSSRGLRCTPEQVLVVRGAQQGLNLVARVLLEPGEEVWVEDPGYPAARIAFAAEGALEVPVPVDEEGLKVEEGRARAPRARLAYVTPSHQFPLGVTLSLSRRLELLQWARETKAWIVEDDYDSEYRYAGRPLASLAGLDGGRHVIYLGTLSKVLFPALRLGYLVVPPEHVDAFAGARFASDRHTSILEQAVVADFIHEGHFGRHLRRMRLLYAKRQRALKAALAEGLGAEIHLRPSQAGLHDVGWLRRGSDDVAPAALAAAAGVNVAALSAFCREVKLPPALLFGYAGFPRSELEAAVRRLEAVFHDPGCR